MGIQLTGIAPLLQVYDMPLSLWFFRDMLGFEIVEQSPGGDDCDWVLLRYGQLDIMFNTAYEKPPDFFGEYVQGPRGNRFIYIDIGTYAGQADTPWSRRLKIPLSNITMEMIQNLVADPSLILETRVPGTGKDGGPNCGTVNPFGGWNIGSGKDGWLH